MNEKIKHLLFKTYSKKKIKMYQRINLNLIDNIIYIDKNK